MQNMGKNMGKTKKGSATQEWHMVVSRGCSTPPAVPPGKALHAAGPDVSLARADRHGSSPRGGVRTGDIMYRWSGTWFTRSAPGWEIQMCHLRHER